MKSCITAESLHALQVEEARRRWQWGSNARAKRRNDLQAELVALDEEDAAAEALVQAAFAAFQDVKRQQPSPGASNPDVAMDL